MSDDLNFTPPPPNGATGDGNQAFGRVWRQVSDALEVHVRATTADYRERDDLMQFARVELLRRDPSRCDLTNAAEMDKLRGILKTEVSREAVKRFGTPEGGDASVPRDS